MPIYTDLLLLSTNGSRGEDRERDAGDAFAELKVLRATVRAVRPTDRRPGSAARRLADQIAYDVALIECCRRVGIESTVEAFDPPEVERGRLEALLASRGVDL